MTVLNMRAVSQTVHAEGQVRQGTGVQPVRLPSSGGKPLDGETRLSMLSHFGHDFSHVRVHTNSEAAQVADALNANAFTVGKDIAFAAGRYRPDSPDGLRLLAHELAHVVQQRRFASVGPPYRLSQRQDPAEREADSLARSFGSRERFVIRHTVPADMVSRQEATPKDPETGSPRPDPGSSATAGPAVKSPTVSLPTCQATEVDHWIKDPQQPNVDLFGLTPVVGTGAQTPTFDVAPAPQGKGVVVQPTSATFPVIQSQHVKAGSLLPLKGGLRLQDGSGRVLPLRWRVTDTGAAKVAEGENEHCQDTIVAFYFSAYRFAEEVNAMASQATVFPSRDAALREFQKKVKIDPGKIAAYFDCVAHQLNDERDKRRRWHTPRQPSAQISSDGQFGEYVLTPSLLPNVGVPDTASTKLFFDVGAPACVGHTQLAQPQPKATP